MAFQCICILYQTILTIASKSFKYLLNLSPRQVNNNPNYLPFISAHSEFILSFTNSVERLKRIFDSLMPLFI